MLDELDVAYLRLVPRSDFPKSLLVLTRTKCEGALLERLQLATDAALSAGAAIKKVISMKKETIIHKGATDL